MSVISKEFNLSGVRITGKTLGRGSYGEVIEVEWCGTLCAAKRMHEIFLKEMPKSDVEKMISDFKRECQTWFSLRHPNIVQLLGNFYQKNSDVPLFLLEKMDISLRHYLENHKKEDFHLLNKVFVLRQVAQGLCYLHHHNPPLVHHDLSPNNILMNKVSFLTKLTDFGMTRTICQSKLTRQSSVKGTQAFMPPEALRIPPRYTEKLDVFSYGNCITTTLIHEWPNPTHPTKEDGDRLVALTEYERREHQINSISTHEKQFFLSLIKGCLANRADSRPSSAELLTEIKRIESTIQSVQPAEVNQLQQAISQLNLEAKQRVQLEQKLEKHLREEHERQEAELSQLRGDVASQNVIIAQLNRDVNELKSENLAIVSEKELIVSRNVQISKDITQLRSTQSSKNKMSNVTSECKRIITDKANRKFSTLAMNKNGLLAVADILNSSVCLFDLAGKLVRVIQVRNNGRLITDITGIEFTMKDNIAINDVYGSSIIVYGINGAFVRSIQADSTTFGLAINRRGIYFCEAERRSVSVYSEEGKFQFKFSTASHGHSIKPVSVTFSPDGLLYVVDVEARSIQVYTEFGAFIKYFTTGEKPNDICVTGNGDLLITLSYSNTIVLYSSDGQQIYKFKTETMPGGIRINSKGEILVSMLMQNYISVYGLYFNL